MMEIRGGRRPEVKRKYLQLIVYQEESGMQPVGVMCLEND